MKINFFVLLNLVFSSVVLANCTVFSGPTVREIRIETCEKLDPSQHPKLKNYRGQIAGGNRTKFMDYFYRGALIKDKNGRQHIYPTLSGSPCRGFPKGKIVKLRVNETCCDTGAWGKCIFGGSFLSDPKGKAINSFQ